MFDDAYVSNGLNEYTTVDGAAATSDGRGNMTGDGTNTFTYDSSNRLISSSTGATLAYDPTGRLMSITQGGSTTNFLYEGTNLLAEYNGAGTLLRRYIHGDGVDDPIVWYEGSGITDPKYLFKDERGSVVAAESASSVTIKRYDEYGSTDGGNVGRFQYTGQTWLPEVGLYYYKARVYSAKLGRFMQTDPIGYKDSMNLYAYVGNDPMNGRDPMGLCEKGDPDCVTVTPCENRCRERRDSDERFFRFLFWWAEGSALVARDATEATLQAGNEVACRAASDYAKAFKGLGVPNTVTSDVSMGGAIGIGGSASAGFYYNTRTGAYGYGGNISILGGLFFQSPGTSVGITTASDLNGGGAVVGAGIGIASAELSMSKNSLGGTDIGVDVGGAASLLPVPQPFPAVTGGAYAGASFGASVQCGKLS